MEPVVQLDEWRHRTAEGLIYFVVEDDPSSPWVKIGFTAHRLLPGLRGGRDAFGNIHDHEGVVDPEIRLSSLQVGNPRSLVLYAAIPASRQQEARVHELLNEQRGRGEWFHLPDFKRHADAHYLVSLITDAQFPAQRQLFEMT